EGEDVVGGRVHAEVHIDASTLALTDPPAGDLPDLAAAGQLTCPAQRAAELVVALEQRHVVAARGSRRGGLHAARTATDHHDLLLLRGRLEGPEPEVVFTSDRRVLHAADRHRLQQVAIA